MLSGFPWVLLPGRWGWWEAECGGEGLGAASRVKTGQEISLAELSHPHLPKRGKVCLELLSGQGIAVIFGDKYNKVSGQDLCVLMELGRSAISQNYRKDPPPHNPYSLAKGVEVTKGKEIPSVFCVSQPSGVCPHRWLVKETLLKSLLARMQGHLGELTGVQLRDPQCLSQSGWRKV